MTVTNERANKAWIWLNRLKRSCRSGPWEEWIINRKASYRKRIELSWRRGYSRFWGYFYRQVKTTLTYYFAY